MPFFGACYTRQTTGEKLGALLSSIYYARNLDAKQAKGNVDKAQWSRMLHGGGALDLNVLYDELPPDVFALFLDAVKAMKLAEAQPSSVAAVSEIVSRFMAAFFAADQQQQQQKEKVA